MNVHATLPASRANGPGRRAVVWFQGCSGMNCPGCWNTRTHHHGIGRSVLPGVLADEIVQQSPDVEGLTVSGGEPMQQAISLMRLLVDIKNRRGDWSIGMFSGYSLAELEAGNYLLHENVSHGGCLAQASRDEKRTIWNAIKGYLDFAVMGRYDRTKPADPGRFVSSSNQSVELFTSRYTMADFGTLKVGVSIKPGGLTTITGFPTVRR